MKRAPLVEITLLRRHLTVVRSAVGVLTVPSYTIRSPPTVKRIRFDSTLLGFSAATMRRYVATRLAGLSV